MRLSTLVLAALLAIPAFCAAEQLLILCDDDGTSSNSDTEVVPAMIAAMAPAPTYVYQPDNGDTGTYSSNETYLNGFDAVYWYASGATGYGKTTTAAEVTACQAYINGGGHMFITGYDLLGDPDDPNMADILNSSTYGDGPFSIYSVDIVDDTHFITNGNYGSFSGSLSISQSDHDTLTADTGGVEIITIPSSTSKCIYSEIGSGSVTGYVGNRYTSDFVVDSYEGILQNWVDHVIFYVGIESASLGEIKAAFK